MSFQNTLQVFPPGPQAISLGFSSLNCYPLSGNAISSSTIICVPPTLTPGAGGPHMRGTSRRRGLEAPTARSPAMRAESVFSIHRDPLMVVFPQRGYRIKPTNNQKMRADGPSSIPLLHFILAPLARSPFARLHSPFHRKVMAATLGGHSVSPSWAKAERERERETFITELGDGRKRQQREK